MRKIKNGTMCTEKVMAVWDQCLGIHWAFPVMRQTLIPQNNQLCGPWEPVYLLTFGAIPANILNIYNNPHGSLLFSELRMALFSFFRVGKANDLFSLDWFKDPWVQMINETVIWGRCCCLMVACITFTYGKHGWGERETNPKPNFGKWTG